MQQQEKKTYKYQKQVNRSNGNNILCQDMAIGLEDFCVILIEEVHIRISSWILFTKKKKTNNKFLKNSNYVHINAGYARAQSGINYLGMSWP